MKINSTSLMIKGLPDQISVRYHLTPIGWPAPKMWKITSVGEGVEKVETVETVGGVFYGVPALGNSRDVPEGIKDRNVLGFSDPISG